MCTLNDVRHETLVNMEQRGTLAAKKLLSSECRQALIKCLIDQDPIPNLMSTSCILSHQKGPDTPST